MKAYECTPTALIEQCYSTKSVNLFCLPQYYKNIEITKPNLLKYERKIILKHTGWRHSESITRKWESQDEAYIVSVASRLSKTNSPLKGGTAPTIENKKRAV
jgi:hypothetical protein